MKIMQDLNLLNFNEANFYIGLNLDLSDQRI